ncbi:MAG: hypothetical protein JWM26_2552 [Betaproteobacteria bacterium]|nr:hypothetical protein [Betaproteobacteria bacterium]
MDTAADRGPAPVPPRPGASSHYAPQPESHEASIMEPIERTFAALRRLATNYALLGVLDMRRAAVQFAWLIGAGIMMTVLVVTAWLALVVALAVWMFGQGLSWPAVLSIAALLNLAAAAFVGWRVKHIFDQKPFSATLRQLKAEPAAQEKQA